MIIDSEDICPIVLIQVMRAARESKDGEKIVVKTRWESVVHELKKWCEETGNEYLGWEKDGEKFVIKMRVSKKK